MSEAVQDEEKLQVYSDIIQIRAFEETILELFSQNKLSGTTHTYIGQEATAVALMRFIQKDDVIFSNHRCHGHYLAYGGPAEYLLAEIMSKKSGLCQGRGGSQHIFYKNFYTNGIQGGIVPNALGVAFANKIDKKLDNTIVFLGDGTLGQGIVYESLNIAAVYEIPLVFVIEDNQYAMSTHRRDVISGKISERIEGFGIRTFEVESTDVDILQVFFSAVFNYINIERKPVCAIIHNYRLGAHSKGDDTRELTEIAEYSKKDPILVVKSRIGDKAYEKIYSSFRNKFRCLAKQLEEEPIISLCSEANYRRPPKIMSCLYQGSSKCVERIQETFAKAAAENSNIIFYGEDVKDPYGGAFKVTKGLSTHFDCQIFNMPISEMCMAGMGVGLAMAGKIPVVEIMFGDFITLSFDQLLNHAVKYEWVYGNDIKIPLIIRTPMGAKRGYGPTHSQSLEKYLIGIPLLHVLALSPLHDPAIIYKTLFSSISSPTVVIENKKMYAEKIGNCANGNFGLFQVKESNYYGYSTLMLTLDDSVKPDYYLVTYGGMVTDSLQAAEYLMMSEEIQVNVIVISQLAPLPIEDLTAFLEKSAKILFVEEGTKTAGIGAEFITSCIENGIGTRFLRIASADLPIPNGTILEKQFIPGKDTIVDVIKGDYYGKQNFNAQIGGK